ncbi:hypothetical protein C8039_08775 [Halogeometricum sp. wsp3]|nr:hypothetical protein C8039_08775 [Halogeometricum sp. wsp3]
MGNTWSGLALVVCNAVTVYRPRTRRDAETDASTSAPAWISCPATPYSAVAVTFFSQRSRHTSHSSHRMVSVRPATRCQFSANAADT